MGLFDIGGKFKPAHVAGMKTSRFSKRASPKDGTPAAMSAWRLRSE